jgi:UDP-N-acetylglucosamine--N-acetylmuramyl-(pentapeptide) pyrophosphoryl-undecaprenol N-acetylglucosamine transferase
MSNYRFMISGGGTGGHIFPALAIADVLQERYPKAQFLFVGAKDRMEMQRVPKAGYTIEGLWISGIQRKLSFKNLVFPFKLLSSLAKSAQLIKKFKPHLVIGTGGFASGPLLYVASQKSIPTLIQEQNSYPGITNKILAGKANKICVAYPGMERFFPKEKMVLTGNPLRKNLQQAMPNKAAAKSQWGFSAKAPVLLILGGSLGAKKINDLVSQNLEELLKSGVSIIWQCGKLYYQSLQQQHPELTSQVKLQAFLNDMPLAYAAADVVVSRAGAGTLSELAAVGKASILIPSPNVAEDHQTKNAKALSEKKAALLFKESDWAKTFLSQITTLCTNEAERHKLEENIAKMALPNAADAIADEIKKLLSHAR